MKTAVAPLYERLPHGPHRLGTEEVIRNQRTRMHGAMIEAVAANGYEGTSVKQVVSLAGVSRRSFYEQFANKQECFLATYDVIAGRGAGRVSAAYRAANGGVEDRMHA
ncbi:MAG TPA: helix-turn-helix domain-containing protein, partial [Solirubrobacteraceae bacterium]